MNSPSKHGYQVPGKLEIPYKYMAGETGSIFLTTLRDKKKIMATRCGKCDTVFIPPRSLCSNCYKKIDEWREVGPKGMVVSFTVVRYQEPHLVKQTPYVSALIKLSGADTALSHVLGEVDPRDVRIGMQVEAVFAQDRKARITDIAYFRPIKSDPKGEKLPAKTAAPTKKAAPAKKAGKPAEKKPAKKAAKKPAKKTAKKPVKKAAKKTVKKTAPKPVKKTVKKPAKKAVKQTAKKPVKKAPKKAVKKPAKKVSRPVNRKKAKAGKKR